MLNRGVEERGKRGMKIEEKKRKGSAMSGEEKYLAVALRKEEKGMKREEKREMEEQTKEMRSTDQRRSLDKRKNE